MGQKLSNSRPAQVKNPFQFRHLDKNAKFFGIDIAHFYLCTPLDRYEYMQLPISVIPDEIIEQYNLQELEHDGKVYIKIKKACMDSLNPESYQTISSLSASTHSNTTRWKLHQASGDTSGARSYSPLLSTTSV